MTERDNELIDPIAAFIAARLQYPCPEINGQGNPWTSTINVEQHKAKFFDVVVYCELAQPDLVQRKWDWCRANVERLKKLPRRHSPEGIEFEGDVPSARFTSTCRYRDALHYRTVYLDMIRLQPHLRSQICSRADHPELLLQQFSELEASLADKPHHVAVMCTKHHRTDQQDLLTYLRGVYEPTTRQRLGLEG